MSTTPTLEGQIILIIGGSSGIGFGVALASLNAGAATVIIGSSQKEKVDGAVERLKAQAGKNAGTIKGIVVDAKDLPGLDKGIKEVGTINHLVWTSGDAFSNPGDMNIKATDLTALSQRPLQLVRFWAAIQAIKSASFAPGGSAVITSGSVYKKPIAGMGIAAGLAACTANVVKGLAVDLAPEIRVNCVAPGLIDTELFHRLPPPMKERFYTEGTKSTALKKIGKPEDVAEAYLFLMKCAYITGQTIDVNGGYDII